MADSTETTEHPAEGEASAPPVLVEREGRVLAITLNRPGNGNAIDFPLADALAEAVRQVDDETGAVLLLGAGKHFCVGGDLEEFGAADEPGPFLDALATRLHESVALLSELDVPVVIGLHGGVGGAGMSLAGIGDVVVCGRSAKLRPAYLAVGLTPDGGMSWTLPRTMGRVRFMDLAMTGSVLRATDALSMGVVSRVVDDDEVVGEASRLAAQLAGGPTASFGRLKKLVRDGEQRDLRSQLFAEATAIGVSAGSPDGREGVAAFLAKRSPKFQG
ncbi:enoyl-CoA hydratase/isomerase family protein [Tomitella cavernea]|uniref:Enoyl-CoA hydratase-related protein n=1 Tax=Tomitella cavernea TaxID=1387982 RepID=A0ABP9CXS4_9ACTN|nr:enoyl-CoA hydratase-related protein [Tomitella cavernea]